MICPSCGREVQDGSTFCPSCGAVVISRAGETQELVKLT